MDNRRVLDSASLSVVCPHCGHTDIDDFEVIEPDGVQRMRCAECGAHFHFSVMGCGFCGAECLFSWARQPAGDVIDKLACLACERSYVEHEESSATSDLSA